MSWLIEPRCCPRSGCVAGAGVEGSSLFLVWGMGRMGTSGQVGSAPSPHSETVRPCLESRRLLVYRQRAGLPSLISQCILIP